MTARENELAAKVALMSESAWLWNADTLRLAAATLRANAERIKALEEALEPFDRALDAIDPSPTEEAGDSACIYPNYVIAHYAKGDVFHTGDEMMFVLGDLRRARAARSNPHV